MLATSSRSNAAELRLITDSPVLWQLGPFIVQFSDGNVDDGCEASAAFSVAFVEVTSCRDDAFRSLWQGGPSGILLGVISGTILCQ